MQTIGLILSYNNPSMTDRLVENIKDKFKIPFNYIVLDNGSDKDKISKYSTHFLDINVRMTRGFNEGIKIIEREFPEYDNIWFFTNDCYFVSDNCPLSSSETFLIKYPEIGILHPSLHNEVNVCYDIKNDLNIAPHSKCVIEYDIVCPIFTRNAIIKMGGMFNYDLFQGWGIDYESSYLVRKAGLKVCINHGLLVNHNTSSTYDKGLDSLHKNRDSYYSAALQEMHFVLGRKYGNWHNIFTNTYIENKGKIYE